MNNNCDKQCIKVILLRLRGVIRYHVKRFSKFSPEEPVKLNVIGFGLLLTVLYKGDKIINTHFSLGKWIKY